MDFPKINLDRCTGCGSCVGVCPMDAISLAKGKAVIDLDQCANCHACESVCPVDAIY
ncbi:MAG: 4Fe-4S binding protein [Mangrovibacterium sp.]|nr:4Fe-4S binding protein [Mangrovibacterium sp.]